MEYHWVFRDTTPSTMTACVPSKFRVYRFLQTISQTRRIEAKIFAATILLQYLGEIEGLLIIIWLVSRVGPRDNKLADWADSKCLGSEILLQLFRPNRGRSIWQCECFTIPNKPNGWLSMWIVNMCTIFR